MTSPLSLFTGLSSKSVIDKYKAAVREHPKNGKPSDQEKPAWRWEKNA